MNFLAHLYLSGDSDKVKIGNFIGDYIKGNKYLNYHTEVQRGIILHRNIDYFMDNHSLVMNGAKRLKPSYGLYSGVVIDMIYDHFLAKKWKIYHSLAIEDFVIQSHEILIKNYLLLPNRVKLFLPFLIQSRRLESYASFRGLQTALNIMSKHTSLPDKSICAIDILQKYYLDYEIEFDLFMRDIIDYVKAEHKINVATPNDWHLNAEK